MESARRPRVAFFLMTIHSTGKLIQSEGPPIDERWSCEARSTHQIQIVVFTFTHASMLQVYVHICSLPKKSTSMIILGL
jgi:hypothetical protein